jgi:hypothetical protein
VLTLEKRLEQRRQTRRRRIEDRTGLKRVLLGDKTAWMRLASQRSLGDQLVDVGVRIAVASAALAVITVSLLTSSTTDSESTDAIETWRLLPLMIILIPVALLLVRWWISYITGAMTLAVVLALMPQIDFSELQRDWNEEQAYRVVEFVLVERSVHSASTEAPEVSTPVEALADEPGAESILVTCTSGVAQALGATVRVAWSTGELADVEESGVWRVRDVVVLSSPKESTLQRRLDAYC